MIRRTTGTDAIRPSRRFYVSIAVPLRAGRIALTRDHLTRTSGLFGMNRERLVGLKPCLGGGIPAWHRVHTEGAGLGGIVSTMQSGLAGDTAEAMLPIVRIGEPVEADAHIARLFAPRGVEHYGDFVAVVDPRGYAIVKRTFDIVFALALLVATLPLWLIVAMLVRMTSTGPVFFRQTRLGRGGRSFTCLKFRSMTDAAEEEKVLLLHLNETSGPVFKLRNDPRFTGVGRWLRKLSLDELPQLLNVLAGDMSMVGPRPPVPLEVEQYEPRQRGRLAVKPGLTCIWQVSGRSEIGFEEWVELDLEYIRRRSFWLDMVLVAQTVPAVVRTRGAC